MHRVGNREFSLLSRGFVEQASTMLRFRSVGINYAEAS